MVHPCRSREDLYGNPRYRMHAYETHDGDQSPTTLSTDGVPLTFCGLEVLDTDRERWGNRFGYAYVCDVCFPSGDGPVDGKVDPWTSARPWDHGSGIDSRGYSEKELCEGFQPET